MLGFFALLLQKETCVYSGNFPKLYHFFGLLPFNFDLFRMANFINNKKQQMSSVSPFFKELGQKEAAKLQGWLTLKASLDFLPGLSFVP